MNPIDKIISQKGNHFDRRRLYCMVLFNYYLYRYYKLINQKFPEMEHFGINNKAEINFLFVCLNSINTDYGLFGIFYNFKISCNASGRIVNVSHPEVERLFAMMPDYCLFKHKWEERNPTKKPKIWNDLQEKPIAEFIHDSSVAKYAKMIDRGFDEMLSKLPCECLLNLTINRQEQSNWQAWLRQTTELNISQHISAELHNRNCEIRNCFSIEQLKADKMQMLANL